MCKNVFKNQEEKARREEFTRLYTIMVRNSFRADATGIRTRQLKHETVKNGN